MAMQHLDINKKNIEEIVNSTSFNDFHIAMKKYLDIEDINYTFLFKDTPTGEDGYIVEGKQASIKFTTDYHLVERITIFTETSAVFINYKFSQVNDENTFYKIAELYLKFILVHELTHVRQLKDGKITEEIVEKNKKIPYNEREIEKEAIDKAARTISNFSSFSAEVVKRFLSNEMIDYEIARKLIELYKTEN